MEGEGVIERVEPRHGCLTRASRKREHVLVANVDQLVIVMSLVDPEVKPNLIDRYLASAEQGGIGALEHHIRGVAPMFPCSHAQGGWGRSG